MLWGHRCSTAHQHSLLTHWPQPPRALRGLQWTPLTRPCHHCLCPPPPWWPLTPIASLLLPAEGAHVLQQPLEQTLVGGTHTKVDLKLQLRPSVHVTNEKSQNLSSWLYKLQSYTSTHGLLNSMPAKRSKSKGTTRPSAPGTGLPFAAVGFVGKYMWGLGQSMGFLHSSHGRSSTQLRQCLDLTSRDL